MTGTERTAWMLHRIYQADQLMREQGAQLPRVESYWEPGAVWMRGEDMKGLHFAAFMAGVALDGAGGLKAMTDVFAAFEAVAGETAGGWLAHRWDGIGDFTA